MERRSAGLQRKAVGAGIGWQDPAQPRASYLLLPQPWLGGSPPAAGRPPTGRGSLAAMRQRAVLGGVQGELETSRELCVVLEDKTWPCGCCCERVPCRALCLGGIWQLTSPHCSAEGGRGAVR